MFLHSADEDAESVFKSSSHTEAQLTFMTPDDRQPHDLTCRQTHAQHCVCVCESVCVSVCVRESVCVCVRESVSESVCV